MKETNKKGTLNRREFLSVGASLGAFAIIPNHVFAAAKKEW